MRSSPTSAAMAASTRVEPTKVRDFRRVYLADRQSTIIRKAPKPNLDVHGAGVVV